MSEAIPIPTESTVEKVKKPRSEAQMKAFAAARAKLMEKNEAKRYSRQQEEAKLEAQRATMESKVKAEIPDAEVKIMERRKPKPKPEPKPKMLEVVIPAHVEQAIEEPPKRLRKPRAPRAKTVEHEYPEVEEPRDAPPLAVEKPRNVLVQPHQQVPLKTVPATPTPPPPMNPYIAMLQARMRR